MLKLPSFLSPVVLLTQPINFGSAQAPPSLLIAGTSDGVVDPGNTIRLAARLREKGAQVQSRLYPGVGHGDLAGAFGKPIRGLAPVLRETVTFVSTVTAKVQEAA